MRRDVLVKVHIHSTLRSALQVLLESRRFVVNADVRSEGFDVLAFLCPTCDSDDPLAADDVFGDLRKRSM